MVDQAAAQEQMLLSYKNPLITITPHGKKRFIATSDVVFTDRRVVLVEREFDPKTHPLTADLHQSISGVSILGGAGAVGAGLGILVDEAINKIRGIGSEHAKQQAITTESIDLLIHQELAIAGAYKDLRCELICKKAGFFDRIIGEAGESYIYIYGTLEFGSSDFEATVSVTIKEPPSKVSSALEKLPWMFSKKQ